MLLEEGEGYDDYICIDHISVANLRVGTGSVDDVSPET